MPNRIEARSAKAALTNATGRLPLLRLFSTPLSIPVTGTMSPMAFHEKAGRSQVGSFVVLLDKAFSPAESPLSPPWFRHLQFLLFRVMRKKSRPDRAAS